jgi:hypothetical protein
MKAAASSIGKGTDAGVPSGMTKSTNVQFDAESSTNASANASRKIQRIKVMVILRAAPSRLKVPRRWE